MSPRYDYDCPNCESRFELRQGFDSEPIAPCPSCETESKRVLYAPQVVYNASGFYTSDKKNTGSGFYVNAYGGKKTGQPPAKDTGDDDGDSGGDADSGGDDHDHASAGASDHSHPHPHPRPD